MRKGVGYRHKIMEDELRVQCWCRLHIIGVHPSVIKAGRTESCGSKSCREPVKRS